MATGREKSAFNASSSATRLPGRKLVGVSGPRDGFRVLSMR